jgi:hypothetical protein
MKAVEFREGRYSIGYPFIKQKKKTNEMHNNETNKHLSNYLNIE